MKTLTINQKVFKHQDTQTKLKIALFEDDSKVSLDNDADYQFKIKNSSGYLKSETLTIEDDRLVLTTDKFKDLTPDAYSFEVWENEDSIYPSENYGYFKITKNTTEVDGEVIPVITIEDFEKRFDEAIKNAKGEKGDTGTIIWHAALVQEGDVPISELSDINWSHDNLYNRKPQVNDLVYDDLMRLLYGVTKVNEEEETVNLLKMANLGLGKSNYDIWLELGNKGTKQDYLDYIAAKSSKVERHAPTGWSLDRSTKPWTVWFDNGAGLQFPDFYNNARVYGYDGTYESGNGGIPRLLCEIATGEQGMPMKQIYNMTDGASLDFFGISKNTKVINPVNTKITNWEELNYSVLYGNPESLPVYLVKIPNIMRVLYGLGIINDDFIENIDKTMPKEYEFIKDSMGGFL